MADQKDPVEGSVQDLFGSAVSAAGSLASSAADKIREVGGSAIKSVVESDIPESVVQFGKNAVDTTIEAVEEVGRSGFSSLVVPDVIKRLPQMKQEKPDIDDEDKELGKKLNQLSGVTMVTDLLSIGKKAATDLVKGSPIDNAIVPTVDKEKFNERVKQYNEKLKQLSKNVADIQGLDPKFSDYRAFNDKVTQDYLAARGKTSISAEDMEDFQAFSTQALASMDQSARMLIEAQAKALEARTSTMEAEMRATQAELDSYLDSNVKASDGKRGSEEYRRLLEEESKAISDSEWISSISRIREKEAEKLESELSNNAKILAKFGGIDEETKDNVIDNMTARRQYYVALLGAEDVPDREKLAGEFKKGAEAQNELDKNVLIAFSARKDAKEFAGLTEVEKRKKILEEEWRKLPEEKRKAIANHESVITGIDTYREYSTMMKGESPLVVLNALSAFGSITQSWVDKYYDYKGEGVPHYVEQETRSLVYAKEGMAKKLVSTITYNSDALLSVIASAGPAGKAAKYGDKLVDFVAKNVDKAGKIARIPVQIGFTNGYLNVVPNTIKVAVNGIVTSAPADAIFDNLMVEAPTKSTEDFNRLTSVFFDTGIAGATFATKRGFAETNKIANNVMWKFMDGDKKRAIDDMVNIVKEKAPELADRETVRKSMEEMAKMYESMYDVREIDQIFKKKGKLYEFLSHNMAKMEEGKLREVLTGNGLGIKVPDLFGMTREQFDDIETLSRKSNLSQGDKDFVSDIETVASKQAMDQSLKAIVRFVEFQPHPSFMQLSKKKVELNKTKYETLKGQVVSAIRELRTLPKDATNEARTEAVSKIENAVIDLQKDFSISGAKRSVFLVDTKMEREFKIDIDDIMGLDEYANKSLEDVMMEGKVTLKEGQVKGVKAGTYSFRTKGQQESADTVIKESIRQNAESLVSALRSLGIFSEDQLRVDYSGKFGEMASGTGNVAQQFLFSVRNVFLSGVTKMEFLKDVPQERISEVTQAVQDALHDFAKKTFGDFVGQKRKSINDPSNGLTADKRGVVPGKELMEFFSSQDGHVNVNGGHFKQHENATEEIVTFYATFGKDVKEKYAMLHERVMTKADGSEQKSVTEYANTVAGKMKQILTRSKKADGTVDIAEGFHKTNVVESTAKYSVFKNGVLDFNKTKDLVRQYITPFAKGGDEGAKAMSEISTFVYEAFKGSDESMEPFIIPMVLNFAYKFAVNKERIDNIIKIGKLQGDGKYAKTFAAVILDPSIVDDIAMKGLPKPASDAVGKIRHAAENAWKNYHSRLEVRSKDLADEIETLKSARTKERDWLAKSNIDKTVAKMKADKSAIDKVLNDFKSKDKFIEQMVGKTVTKANVKAIEAQTDRAAYKALLEQDLQNTKIKEVESAEKQIESTIELHSAMERVIKKDENVDLLRGWMAKLKSARGKNEILALLDHGFEGDLKTIADGIASKHFHGYENFRVYDEKGLLDAVSKHYSGVMTMRYVKENNPVALTISTAVSGGRQFIEEADMLVKAMVDEFGIDEGSASNLQELYHASTKFRSFIDSLYSSNERIVKDWRNEIVKKMSEAFDKAGIKFNVEGKDFTRELFFGGEGVKGLVHDKKTLNKIKNVALKKLDEDDIFVAKVEDEDGREFMTADTGVSYSDTVIVQEEIKKANVPMRFMRNAGSSAFSKFRLTRVNEKKESGQSHTTLGSLVNGYFEAVREGIIRSKLSSDVKDKLMTEYNYASETYSYEIVKSLINGSPIPSQFNFDLVSNLKYSKFGKLQKVGTFLEYAEYATAGYGDIAEQFRNTYGIRDNEMILGGFGDKDSTFKIYDSTKLKEKLPGVKQDVIRYLATVEYALAVGYYNLGNDQRNYRSDVLDFEAFTDFVKEKKAYSNAGDYIAARDEWFNKNDGTGSVLLHVKDIAKREGSSTSERRVMDSVKKQLKAIIIKELIPMAEVNGEMSVPEFFSKEFYEDVFDIEGLRNKIAEIRKTSEHFANELDSIIEKEQNFDTLMKEVFSFIDNAYTKDLQDGTSFVSNDLMDLMNRISGDSGKKNAKHHFLGNTGKGLFLGKTLFNSASVYDMKGNALKDTVVFGDSSVKLKAGINESVPEDMKFINIDGRVYEVKGFVEGTDTSFFKSAATESTVEKEEIGVSTSIKNHLDQQYVDAFDAVQRKQLVEATKGFLESIGRYDIDVNTFSDVDALIARVSSEFGVGIGSDSIIQAKLGSYLQNVKKIMEKPLQEGQSAYIKESNYFIKPNQIIMSEDSHLVGIIRKQMRDELESLKADPVKNADAISKLENDIRDGKGLFAVGFRYPVPSKYGIGAFEIILSKNYKEKKRVFENGKWRVTDEFVNPYSDLPANDVIPHPHATYAILQGDNDGDHIFFNSVRSDYGEVLAKNVLKIPMSEDVVRAMEQGWKNDFVVVAQVEKGKVKDVPMDERTSAGFLAKKEIRVVASTIRTIDVLEYVFKKMKNMEGSELESYNNKRVKIGDEITTYGDLFEKYGTMEITPKFNKKAASVLQLTIDFMNSGEVSFKKDWYVDMIMDLGLGMDRAQAFDFYHDVLSPLAKTGTPFDVTDAANYRYLKDAKIEIAKAETGPIEKSEFKKKYGARKSAEDIMSIIGPDRETIEWLGQVSKKEGINVAPSHMVNKLNSTFTLEFVAKELGSGLEGNYAKVFEAVEFFAKSETKETGEYWSFASRQIDGKWTDPKKELPKAIRFLLKEDLESVRVKFQGSDASYGKLFDTVDRMKELKSIKESRGAVAEYVKLERDLYSPETISSMDRGQRFALATYAMLRGEARPFKILTETERVKYLVSSDERMVGRMKDLDVEIEKNVTLEELMSRFDASMKGAMDEIEKISDPELRQAELDVVEAKREAIVEKFENASKEVGNVTDNVVSEDIPTDIAKEFHIPDISFKEVDVNAQTITELASSYKDVQTQFRNGLKLTVDSLFRKYAPSLYATYNGVRDLMMGDAMNDANKHHVYEFSDGFVVPSDNLFKRIKRTGLTTERADYVSKVFQRAMLYHENGNWRLSTMDEARSYVLGKLKKQEYSQAAKLVDDTAAMKRLEEYGEKTVAEVANRLNLLQTKYGVGLHDAYMGHPEYAIVTDAIEAFKNDPQLALKISGIHSEEAFMTMLEENAKSIGTSLFEGTKRILRNAVFTRQKDVLDHVLDFLQSFHYTMTYGSAATILTQNNVFAGLSQVLPNRVELKSYMYEHQDRIDDAWKIIQKYGIMDSENVLRYSSGHGKELRENRFDQFVGFVTKDLVEKGAAIAGFDRKAQIKSGELVNSFITNMLGFNDWPLENLRKMVAVMQTMDRWGVKDARQLDEMFENGGRRMVDLFRAHSDSAFIDSGGGVVTSGIGRGTVFEYSYEYLNILPVRFAVKSLGYLMGWSFHKAATLLEKETAMLTAIKLMASGDVKAGIAHAEDWFRYNSMLAKQLAYSAALFLKFQKYEKDDKDRMDFDQFKDSFMNSIVSLEILAGRHIKQYEVSSELSPGDEGKYLAYGIVDRMFRLFKQPGFIGLAYDKYRLDSANGEGDMAAALMFAMDKRYTAYMSMSGMQYADDAYRSLTHNANIGMLGTGGMSVEDELLAESDDYKSFAKWKEKGSVMSFISGFTGMFKTQDDNLSYSVAIDHARKLRDEMVKNPELRKLLNGGQIGTGEGDYDIANVIGKDGMPISDQERKAISDIWTKIKYGGYSRVDDKGRRIRDDGSLIDETKEQKLLEDQITREFKKNGFDVEAFTKSSGLTPELVKILATLELKSNLKTPLVLATLMQMEEKRRVEETREEGKGLLTGKVTGTGKYRKEWTELSENDLSEVRRNVLSKYQEYLNLDNTAVHEVIEQHVRKYHGETLDAIGKISNFNTVESELMNLLKSQQLVTNNMKLYGDVSSVTKLQSRYALAMRGFSVNTDVGVAAALKWMKDVEDAPWMDKKSKLAHQAAIIYGLNKTQYGVLSKNEKFEKLTEGSRRLLTNWLYKVSSESLDYDSKSYMNQLNESASKSSALKDFNPKFKSKAFSGKRPNFGKQFDPVRQMIPEKAQYLSQSPDDFIRSAYGSMPQRFGINPTKFEKNRDFQVELFRQTFFGYESLGLPRPGAKPKEKYGQQVKLKKKSKKPKKKSPNF